MTRPLVVLRPEPGLGETLAIAQSMGLEAVPAPLFEVGPVAWHAPDPARFDAILAGSANAFRHGGATLSALTPLPVHAVGERTARAAREAGFAVASTGGRDLQTVLDALPTPARLLRLAGDRRVPLAIPEDVTIEECVVYRAMPLPLTDLALHALRSGAIALLHSGEAARRLADECDRLAIDRSGVTLAALAPRIAEAAGPGWQAVVSASEPTDLALLVLAGDICQ